MQLVLLSDRRGIRAGCQGLSLLLICALFAGCSERLTPSRAGTIIRHSKAFLSGAPASDPAFDGVSALLPGSQGSPPDRQEGDSYIAEFSYHWPPNPPASDAGQPPPTMKGRVVLRRSVNGWEVDDVQSRALIPTWPQLPGAPNPFLPGASR